MTLPLEHLHSAELPKIATARAEDLPWVRALLAAAGLPGSDLAVEHMRHFWVVCRPYSDADAKAWCSATSLPTRIDGSSAARANCLIDERSAGRVLGIVGLEICGPAALLRSLAVAPQHRGKGIGHVLVETVEAQARAHDIDNLFLLTTTAEPFFARLGYVVVPRSEVPADLRAVPEFSSLCPAAAVCMRKRLSA